MKTECCLDYFEVCALFLSNAIRLRTRTAMKFVLSFLSSLPIESLELDTVPYRNRI